jgi:O-methyltransferase
LFKSGNGFREEAIFFYLWTDFNIPYMKLPVFQILNYSLILIVLILFIRYIWDILFDRGYQPASWQEARKKRAISRDLLRSERNYPDKVRFFSWWIQVERLRKENVPGSFAELGVYQGESARVIHQMEPGRRFHLFDTFEGFREGDLNGETGEAATYTTDHFADTTPEKVLRRMGGDGDIRIHKGNFPDTTVGLDNERFAFVNIDCDLYKPTRAGFQFFYPRLSPGGVIFIHDYNPKWPGVVQAVEEFRQETGESFILLPDMEGTVMIVRR